MSRGRTVARFENRKRKVLYLIISVAGCWMAAGGCLTEHSVPVSLPSRKGWVYDAHACFGGLPDNDASGSPSSHLGSFRLPSVLGAGRALPAGATPTLTGTDGAERRAQGSLLPPTARCDRGPKLDSSQPRSHCRPTVSRVTAWRTPAGRSQAGSDLCVGVSQLAKTAVPENVCCEVLRWMSESSVGGFGG